MPTSPCTACPLRMPSEYILASNPFFFFRCAEGRSSQTDQLHMGNLVFYIINDFPVCFCCGMMCFIDNQIDFLFTLQPWGQTIQIASNAVLAGNEQIVARLNITGPVMAGSTGYDVESERRRNMRKHFCIGENLKRRSSLIQKHLTMCDP